MRDLPQVIAEAPSNWRTIDLAAPTLATAAGAEMTQWTAAGAGGAVLVTGCVATPIPGWVEDMRPNVEARTVALAGKATSAITNRPMDARPAGELFQMRAASDLDGPILATARTFLGFDESRVFTCFATCAGDDACTRTIAEARLTGSLAPPRPGLGLRAVTWGVHHPRGTATGGGVAIAILAVLAVVLRRRPRFSD
jgi:hypothetical protein